MALIGFICPDGERVSVEDCLKECRLHDRCQEEPDLVAMSEERKWAGVASTTQLITGTMEAFLKLTQPYYVDPDTRVFMLQGIKHHKQMEEVAKELGMAVEIPLSVDRDIFDLLVFHDQTLCLVDRKLWGSFRVAKALGIKEVGRQPDQSGARYKRSGKWGKEGDPKMIPLFDMVPEEADNHEAEFQLNRYRILIKEKMGLTIGDMYLRVVVRDGGLRVAKDRGVFRRSYKIPIRFLDDAEVKGYFAYKDACLHQALEQGHWEMPCIPEECWNGAKCCKEYCDVLQYCPKGGQVQNTGGEE